MKYYGKIQSPQDLITKKYCDNLWIANVASEYDATVTYNKNDVVIYETALYKCNTDNTTGTWDSSKWIQFTINKSAVLDGPLLRDNGSVHPQAPTVDFSDTTTYPAMANIKTYVTANPDQIATLKTIYSLFERALGRSIAGDTLSMSSFYGDTEENGILTPADDVTISGDTLNIP